MNLALYGSGEFTDSVNKIDSYLVRTFKPKSVAVIPTAAGTEHDVAKWFDLADRHFDKYHIKVVPVPIFNKDDANNLLLVELIDRIDWIFFSGGDPNFLFQSLDSSLLWQKVLERLKQGVLLSGSSAGAMVMGNYILNKPFKALFANNETVWQKAFGLVDYTIFPHFDHFKKYQTILKKIVEKSPQAVGSAWLGIDENTALVIQSNKQTVHGLGKVEMHHT